MAKHFTKRNNKSPSFVRMPVCRRSVSSPSTSAPRCKPAPVSLSREETAELRALAQLLPVHSRHPANDPCSVLQAAAQYIDQLRTTVVARVRNGTLPPDALSKIYQLQSPVEKTKRKGGSKSRK